MIFNEHSRLEGRHAILSPSYHHWLNYNEQKLQARMVSLRAARRGTDLHALAHEAIRLGVRLSKANQALATYVADAIGYKMECEQPLYYSENCFGHADTISFRRSKLRIHDLKTGVGNTTFKQLEVYAAIFCLEYVYDPYEIEIELRLYQGEGVRTYIPDPEVIADIMDKIVEFDKKIEAIRDSDR